MNALGLPILNDRMYPPVADTPKDDYRYPLQLLAQAIEFTDPVTRQARRFESRLSLAWPAADSNPLGHPSMNRVERDTDT
jgi:tRNA pseudouridine32 synthase/23S rRNA pseudouridine746 synthase